MPQKTDMFQRPKAAKYLLIAKSLVTETLGGSGSSRNASITGDNLGRCLYRFEEQQVDTVGEVKPAFQVALRATSRVRVCLSVVKGKWEW